MKFNIGDKAVVNHSDHEYYNKIVAIEGYVDKGRVYKVRSIDDNKDFIMMAMYLREIRDNDYSLTRPAHYASHPVEPIDLIVAHGWGEAFCASNVIKYVSRYSEKNGDADLEKASQYLQWLVQLRKTGRIEK
jgi:hypothetical protein